MPGLVARVFKEGNFCFYSILVRFYITYYLSPLEYTIVVILTFHYFSLAMPVSIKLNKIKNRGKRNE